MENTLKFLLTLQNIDNNLDEVEESKGDLPSIVRNLEEQIHQLNEKANAKREYIDSSVSERNKADDDIHNFEEKLKRYKDQQYKVRNNKEYDAITKEIDFAQESIKELTKKFEDFENQMSVAKSELEEITAALDELNETLSEKKKELAKVSKETQEEEDKYKHEREKIIGRIPKQFLSKYEMIRNFRGKVAVSVVRKQSCSGCGNRIPPQHIVEIRKNDHLYLCQHCGRIIVSDEINM